MMTSLPRREALALARESALSDDEIVRRVRAGDAALFEVLVRRHNQRVYRAVRAVVRDEAEVEDVMQHAYLAAYTHLHQYAGASRFSTWLIRIAINEARGLHRRAARLALVSADVQSSSETDSPEAHAATRELTAMLGTALDQLPEIYRTVFVLRELEELATAEAAEALEVTEDVVKVRLHRAKALVRESFAGDLADRASVFRFEAPRCDRVTALVLAAIDRVGAMSSAAP
jgi:RNA polymerase sigma-70 factor (ECF subfamily)